MADAETKLIAETFETVERACIPSLEMAGPTARPPKMWYDVVPVFNLDEEHAEVCIVERELGGFVQLEHYEQVTEALRDAEEEIRELKAKEKA